MKDKIGIGILDIYSPEDIQKCYSSIPKELQDDVFVVSNTNNKVEVTPNTKRFDKEVPFASLRNWLISQLRFKDYKFLFLLHSNVSITDPEIFNNTIKTAETFGTWFLLGPGSKSVPIEDDENNVTLHLTPELNDTFMFLYTGVVKNNGYFDERVTNTKNLDVLDFILKMRKKGIYPPNHYHPTIEGGITTSNTLIQKIGYKDIPDLDRSVQLSYSFFMHIHQYLPGQNDPAGVTQDELLKSMENIQKNYAKKNIV
jgi:hypothetical protein